jgi:hypothetical protein
MTNAQNAIAAAERVVSDAEGGKDPKGEKLAHAQAQTILLKALLEEIAALRADLAAKKG